MSFGWNVLFRTGSWLEYRAFILNQRRNVVSRIEAIDRELSKIGRVKVLYQRENPEDPESNMTEKRVGLEIDEGATLTKLLRAYIARGGNPFDISMFLKPDSYEYIVSDDGPKRIEDQPYGGVVYPKAEDMEEDQVGLGGALVLWKEPKRKLDQKGSIWDDDRVHELGRKTLASRKWVRQEIKELRNDLEARILKLCDLREQLLIEKNEIIVQAVGGSVEKVEFNPDVFLADYNVSKIVDVIDTDLFEADEEGKLDFSRPKAWVNKYFNSITEDVQTGEDKFTAL